MSGTPARVVVAGASRCQAEGASGELGIKNASPATHPVAQAIAKKIRSLVMLVQAHAALKARAAQKPYGARRRV